MREPPLILIVDDNPANVEILQMRLMANSYDIITATDGEMGLDLARNKHPDLILLDIMMPKLDGFEVLSQLKSDNKCKKMPIIVLTTSPRDKDIERAYNLGCNSYICKPVNFENFIKAVIDIHQYWLVLCKIP